MLNANRQMLYGPAAQQHYVGHFQEAVKDIQNIKKNLGVADGRKVDKLRNKLTVLISKASLKVDSLVY